MEHRDWHCLSNRKRFISQNIQPIYDSKAFYHFNTQYIQTDFIKLGSAAKSKNKQNTINRP